MAEFVFFMLIAVPAVLGLSEILHIFKRWFFLSDEDAEKLLFIIPDNDNFQKQVLALYNEYKWHGNNLANKIVVVTSGLDEESRKECNKLAQKVGFKALKQENFNILEI